MFICSTTYVVVLIPSPTCTGYNADGDNVLNHLDPDSDGDRCPDAVERRRKLHRWRFEQCR
ncbi:MAG: hypothetical protein IPN46_08390 [Saprospiraceae bacterium]|nr:hypothetical protein [Saprospiraceae bacterium]